MTAARTSTKAIGGALLVGALFAALWLAFPGTKQTPGERRVAVVAVSRTGRWLAGGTAHGDITIRDQRGGGPRRVAFPHGSLNDLQFSPDEQVLAIAAGDLALCAPDGPAAPRLIRADRSNYGTVRFSPDGQTILTITGAGAIETLDAHSGAPRIRACCSSVYGEVAFTPDGQAIANAGHWPGLWDARSGRLIARLTWERQVETFRPIAFDTSRGTILMGSQDGRVYVWDLRERLLLARSEAQTAYVDTLVVAPAGWIAYAGFDDMVRWWNPETGQRHDWPSARPTSNLVVGPDGGHLVFGTADGQIEYWDIGTGRRVRSSRIGGTEVPRGLKSAPQCGD